MRAIKRMRLRVPFRIDCRKDTLNFMKWYFASVHVYSFVYCLVFITSEACVSLDVM